MTAYYNEINPDAAAHLRGLIAAGHIAPGIVDERSIEDVRPDELVGYTQCHFFAGIGIWSLALRQAGIPDDYPVWSMSCPCQPFSAAGQGKGFADERHLWPAAYHLISQCRPERIVGEQVDAAIKSGWWDLVADDLEAIGYAAAASVIPASAVGAPHMRHRLFFVAKCGAESYNIVNAPHLKECNGNQNLPQMSFGKTDGSILFGEAVSGREALLLQAVRQGAPHHVPDGFVPRAMGRPEDATQEACTQGERLLVSAKDDLPSESAGLSMQTEGCKEACAVRLGSARESITEPNRRGVLRTDGHTVSSGLVQELRQPITGQDSAGTRVYVCQREGCLLCDELRAGNMGRSAFALDVGSLEEEKGSLKNDALDVIQAHSKNDNDTGGQTDIGNQGVGAPHIRDRAYWCAGSALGDTSSTGLERFSIGHRAASEWQGAVRPIATAGESGGVADAWCNHHRSQINAANHGQPQAEQPANRPCGCGGASCQLADTDSELRDGRGQCGQGWRVEHSIGCTACRVANMHSDGCAARGEIRPVCQKSNAEHGGATCGLDNTISIGRGASRDGNHTGDDGQQLDANGSNDRPGPVNGHWSAADWLHCRDGKWRSVEPGTFPLAYGMPRSMGAMPPELRGLAELAGLSGDSLKRAKNYRVSSLKGYGNAINARAAQAFIECLFYPLNQPPAQQIRAHFAIKKEVNQEVA